MDLLFGILAFSLAVTIGGSNGGTVMAAPYSARTLSPRQLCLISGVAIFLGAFFLGKNVLVTLGEKLAPSFILSQNGATLTFYINSIVYILLANILKVPIATTHIVSLSIVGIGIATDHLYLTKFIVVVCWWIATPAIAFILGYIFEKFLYFRILNFAAKWDIRFLRMLFRFLIVVAGAYFGFSAGANNLGNSVAFLYARGYPLDRSVLLGALFMFIGSQLFGPSIAKKAGTKIVELGLLRAIYLLSMEATIILIASFFGIPISINETMTAGMIGISAARGKLKENIYIRYIAFFWFAIPWIGLATAVILFRAVDLLMAVN